HRRPRRARFQPRGRVGHRRHRRVLRPVEPHGQPDLDAAQPRVLRPRSMSDELRSDQGIPSLRTVAMPADANPNGDIFGGWLMSQMDLAGGTFAAHVARGRVVTVAVDGMTFHKPVNIGDQVSCYCTTERIGRTSISVRVETWIRPR